MTPPPEPQAPPVIRLYDTNPEVVREWRNQVWPACVEIHEGCLVEAAKAEIKRVEFDHARTPLVVSPANSLGFMDGGIDAAYERAWPGTELAVRQAVNRHSFGEVPVGLAIVVEILGRGYDLCVAPTMRIPQRQPPPLAPYLAARAVMVCALARPRGTVVLCPGLGTGSALIGAQSGARQMARGFAQVWSHVVEGPDDRHWRERLSDHDEIPW